MVAPGIVIWLYIAPTGGAEMRAVHEVAAVAGRGLDGDRYFNRTGTYSNLPGDGRHVTLIESEALEALRRDYGITLDPSAARRNIVTRGVALNHWIGQEFRVGTVTLRGTRLCEPCLHLQKLSVANVMRGLVHRGGLRAEILAGGMIRVGDPILVAQR
jgi:MOSC domain-containing protein YiiM